MQQVTKDTELIIGIDFGSSETSASLYGLRNQEQRDLDILPGLKVVKSAVAILEQEGRETICIGDAAIHNAPLAKDFQIAFKKNPSEMDGHEREKMVTFMKGVYTEILKNNPIVRTHKHVIYLASPSSMPTFEIDEYLEIAEDAGLPVAGIINKSVASFFYILTGIDSPIRQYKDGVLIVDYGSNTIDFSYFRDLSHPMIYDESPLGASEVEETLLRYAMDNPSDNCMPLFVKMFGNNKESNPYNQMLYKFREAKEQFFGYELPVFNVMFDYELLTWSETTPICGFGGITIPKDKINDILGMNRTDGYIGKVKEAVKSFKENKLKSNKVTRIYLTGGASRMDFVRQIFMETFNLDVAHCQFDVYPSVTVSRAIAKYANYSLKYQYNI